MTDEIERIDWAAMKDMLRAPDKVSREVAASRGGQVHRHKRRIGHVFNKRKLDPPGERQCPKCGSPAPDLRYRRCAKCRAKQRHYRERVE